MSFGGGGGGSSSISASTDVALSNPADGQVLAYNATLGKWQNAVAPAGGTAKASESFTYFGDLQTGTGAVPLYNDSGSTRTITSVRASVGTAPTGASIIVDVNVGGSTIFITPSDRPTIAASGTTSGAVSRNATWSSGQGITVDVDQVGSTIAGQNLIVTVEYQ